MCLNVAANVADIIDGPIARATPNRRRAFSVVGCKLDCYSDLVSHFVVPASLLMHMSDGNVVCTGLAAAYVCSGILRQSYFEVTGRCEGGACIYGVTSDYMVAIYVLAMHLLPFVGRSAMPFVVLVPAVGLMIAGSLTFAVRSRRYDGFGLLTVTVYNVSLCASCLALTAFETSELFELVAAGLFAVHLLLAYPCYFRFVEINS
jgi:phosphatidylserine synthase